MAPAVRRPREMRERRLSPAQFGDLEHRARGVRQRPGDELQQQLALQRLAEDGEVARLDGEAAGAADHVAQVELHDRLVAPARAEEHTSALQSLMRISYAGFCCNKKQNKTQ